MCVYIYIYIHNRCRYIIIMTITTDLAQHDLPACFCQSGFSMRTSSRAPLLHDKSLKLPEPHGTLWTRLSALYEHSAVLREAKNTVHPDSSNRKPRCSNHVSRSVPVMILQWLLLLLLLI